MCSKSRARTWSLSRWSSSLIFSVHSSLTNRALRPSFRVHPDDWVHVAHLHLQIAVVRPFHQWNGLVGRVNGGQAVDHVA